MDKTADRLADFAATLAYEDLSEKAIHSVKRSFIDSLGCAFGAFDSAPAQALRSLATQISASQPATIIGTALKTSPELAAFVNGGMVRYLDFSDDYFGGTGDIGPHPSDNICAVLAAAESAGRDGRSLILGIVIAYEACGQITEKIDLKGRKPTWDYPILHAISSSLGAAKVLGLSGAEIREALALAVVPNVCLQQTRHGELSNWKGLAGPNASRNGVFAAMMARAGLKGPDEPFEGKGGLMKHLDISFELGDLGGATAPFKVEETFYKCIPVRYSAQLPIWVALEARRRIPPAEIETIRVFVPRRYVTARSDSPESWNPLTRETADHSFPYLISAALIDGEISERTFTPARFRDATILEMVQRIDMAEDPSFSAAFPQNFNCRFEIVLKSGEHAEAHLTNPKGHPKNPMSDREIEDKFRKQAAAAGLSERQSRALLDASWSLDKIDDLQDLFALMRAPAV